MDQLIAVEAPKKRTTKKVAVVDNLKGTPNRIPAAVKKF